MIALHVVLVDTIVLQVDKNAVDEANPKGRCGQVGRECTQRELITHRAICRKLKGLHGTLGHGEHQDGQAQYGSTY